MDNPETLATLGTQDTGWRQAKQKYTTQKTKKMNNTDTNKKTGMNSGAHQVFKAVPASYKTPTMLTHVGHHYTQ